METLTPAGRRALRARAHALAPVAMIGGDGLSDSVMAEIERGLKSHELIKIRVFGDDRHRREALLEEICARTGAAPVQHIGKILVIHRKNPEAGPKAQRPKREGGARAAPGSRARVRSRPKRGG